MSKADKLLIDLMPWAIEALEVCVTEGIGPSNDQPLIEARKYLKDQGHPVPDLGWLKLDE